MIGKVLEFLSYREIMVTVRYLNKGFIHFTSMLMHYLPDEFKTAILKANLSKIYTGKAKMPMITHSYYKN